MASIPGAIGPARLRQTPAGLRIMIPEPTRWSNFFYCPLGLVMALWYLQQSGGSSPVVRILVGGLITLSLAKVVRNLLSRDVVIANKTTISIRREVGGFGRRREYYVNRIYNLRYVRLVTTADCRNEFENCPGFGNLAFDYHSSTHNLEGRFAEAEAQELVRLLKTVTGAPLTSIATVPDHPLPKEVVAEELHRNRGWILIYVWFAVVIYGVAMPFNRLLAVRVGLSIVFLGAIAMSTLSASGYRYRFTYSGLEIYTWGFRIRFIPVGEILSYEPARWSPADRWNFGIFGRRSSYIWGGAGVRIQLLDGQVYLGHELPQKIVADLDKMKQLPVPSEIVVQAASAGTG